MASSEHPFDVFVSYHKADSSWVTRSLVPRLKSRGLRVFTDHEFELGVPKIINLERAVKLSDHTLLILTPSWIESDWDELGSLLSSATDPAGRRRKLIPVILKPCDLPPRLSILAAADLTQPDEDPEDLLNRLVDQIASQPEETTSRPLGNAIHDLFLSYDWEDRHRVRTVIDCLRKMGISVHWDLDWPSWADRTQELEKAIAASDLILSWSTRASVDSEWQGQELQIARSLHKPILSLDLDGESRSAEIKSVEGINVQHLTPEDVAKAIIGKKRLAPQRSDLDAMDASEELIPEPGAEVKSLLQSAFQANWYLPFDTLIDKLILHPLAGDLITKAYQIASAYLDVHNHQRLQATLEFGRLLRFRGNWDEALKIFTQGEFEARGIDNELHNMFLLELGSLQFEQGVTGGIETVEDAFEKIRKKGITVLLVKALRQLGNMYREHSDWDKAEKYLNSALTIAEILKDIEDLTSDQSLPNSLYLLWIDCIRERASLLTQQGKSDEAVQQLQIALQAAQNERIKNASEYLSGVILYQLGKINLQHIRDERTALNYLEQSLEILHKYDNPIRLAFVYDALGGVLSRTHTMGGSKEKAERYFEKAKRIRELSKHEYFVAYSVFRQAESSQLHGDLRRAITQFQQARTTFNKLGKTYDLGLAWLQLGKCRSQLGNRDSALQAINFALDEFKKLNLDSKIREAEFLRMRLLLNDPHKYETGRDLRELLRQQTEDYKFHLNEIGEYTFHEWIKEMSKGKTPNVPLLKAPYTIHEHTERPEDNRLRKLVSVGIGDDAAVLGIPGSEIYEVVLTTDAAPGSLSRSVDVDKGKYAAKFSVVHSVSDILAMGATPVAILLNFYMNREATLEYAMAVLETVADVAADYGVALIGGDLKERKEQSIGCMALGVVEKGKSISRSTAREGQVVAITLAGMPDGSGVRKIGCRWAQEVIEYMGLSEIEPYKSFVKTDWKRDMLFLCHKEMIAGARTGLIRSAIDTSDGVMACLELIGRNSGVSFELDEALIEQIIDDRVKEISKALEFRPSQFLFNAGHDWEIVLTVEEKDFSQLQQAFQQAGGDLARLGIVRPFDPNLKGGISMISSRNQKKIWIPFFTDEKFVLRAYEERELDWEDLSFYINGARELS